MAGSRVRKPRRAAPRKPVRRRPPAPVEAAKRKDDSLREHVLYLLQGGGAHLNFEKAVVGLPAELRGVKPAGLPYSAWQLVEHMRIAQWDILEFCRKPGHVSPSWPEGYWPAADSPPDPEGWERSLAAFRAGLKAMARLVAGRKTDLYAKIPRGDGQTILREALLVADHNAYHLGQLVLLRRLLGAWED